MIVAVVEIKSAAVSKQNRLFVIVITFFAFSQSMIH
jgi:hypothetical protein